MRKLILVIWMLGGALLATAEKITLEDVVIKGTFAQAGVSGFRSMNDGLHYTILEGGARIVQYSYKTGQQTAVLFDLASVENAPIKGFSAYTFSDDEQKILLTTAIQPIYRRSFTAEYYVWTAKTKELAPLSAKGAQQVATFSPDGDRIAFVRNNNLYIKSLKFGTESQVTNDGRFNEVINGIPDWVYEEEFSYNKAFAWSPDSRFLAFTRFDESAVKEFSMSMFGGQAPFLAENELYPSLYTFKYPKAGEKNSSVSVRVYDVTARTTVNVDMGADSDIYVPRLKWKDAAELGVFRMNRRQNQLDVLMANPFTGDTRLFFTEKNERYVDEKFLDDFNFIPETQYITVISERNGYSHLYLYNRQGLLVKQLTDGQFDVTAFYGYNPATKMFYYQAAKESPLRREVYFVSLDGKKQGRLSSREGTTRVEFSAGFKYYLCYFTNHETPLQVELFGADGKLVRILEDNSRLQEKLAACNISRKEFFTFTNAEGTLLNGYMLKPTDFDPSRRYPVVMVQYSGPNSQEVSDTWSIGWEHYLAQEGFIIACVDPRGTAARGEEFRKTTYLRLGAVESDDQIAAARHIATLPYVDKANIAIWGWSFGGFMTLMSMTKGGDVFKAGIAVAPLTHHKFYDTVYTERYMRTPRENPDGYRECTPFNYAAGLKGRLLIIHGSADDNVHLQNTVEMAEAFVQADVPFEMAVYTNRNHGIYGGATRLHLYKKMTRFFMENLK
ncbi:MAG: S9 family peptidase [Bacteroidales bacterium]|jgi:dipeptidyl-peptidase-4|nr:S9 family peptidase [Bacteroidales bacterium]